MLPESPLPSSLSRSIHCQSLCHMSCLNTKLPHTTHHKPTSCHTSKSSMRLDQSTCCHGTCPIDTCRTHPSPSLHPISPSCHVNLYKFGSHRVDIWFGFAASLTSFNSLPDPAHPFIRVSMQSRCMVMHLPFNVSPLQTPFPTSNIRRAAARCESKCRPPSRPIQLDPVSTTGPVPFLPAFRRTFHGPSYTLCVASSPDHARVTQRSSASCFSLFSSTAFVKVS